jgi:2-phospho-L-lactate transferase/gluconeogenesis factor (CofD/UPF0052 family)
MGRLDKDFEDYYSLKQHFEDKFLAIDKFFEMKYQALAKLMNEKFSHIDKTTEEAKRIMEKRLKGMNEFRGALKDQTSLMLSREEYGIQHQRLVDIMELHNKKLEDDVRMLRESKATLEGKASQESVEKLRAHTTVMTIIAVISILVSIVAIIITIILNHH